MPITKSRFGTPEKSWKSSMTTPLYEKEYNTRIIDHEKLVTQEFTVIPQSKKIEKVKKSTNDERGQRSWLWPQWKRGDARDPEIRWKNVYRYRCVFRRLFRS